MNKAPNTSASCAGTTVSISTLLAFNGRSRGGVEDDGGYGYHGYGRRRYRSPSPSTHSLTEIYNDRLSIKRAVNVDGTLAADDLALEVGDFVQKDALNGEPDEEEFSGFTGNEGATATHIY
jgi:hypothetical protein